jgi:4-hydroxy-3-polyprenylbenzoate decarboxylase
VLALARDDLLVVVDEPINKDTEMHPLVRWQYRGGIAEPDRKAFLFTQPTDSKGRRYDGAVLVAGLAANRAVYRTGFGKPLKISAPPGSTRSPIRSRRAWSRTRRARRS